MVYKNQNGTSKKYDELTNDEINNFIPSSFGKKKEEQEKWFEYFQTGKVDDIMVLRDWNNFMLKNISAISYETFTLEQTKEWIDAGITKPITAKEWIDAGITKPITAKEWIDAGVQYSQFKLMNERFLTIENAEKEYVKYEIKQKIQILSFAVGAVGVVAIFAPMVYNWFNKK
jgi:hypothetical protein